MFFIYIFAFKTFIIFFWVHNNSYHAGIVNVFYAEIAKFRPETRVSVGMGDSWWKERCLNFRSSFVALGGSGAWQF